MYTYVTSLYPLVVKCNVTPQQHTEVSPNRHVNNHAKPPVSRDELTDNLSLPRAFSDCAVCEKGYSLSLAYTCSKCSSYAANMVLVVAICVCIALSAAVIFAWQYLMVAEDSPSAERGCLRSNMSGVRRALSFGKYQNNYRGVADYHRGKLAHRCMRRGGGVKS